MARLLSELFNHRIELPGGGHADAIRHDRRDDENTTPRDEHEDADKDGDEPRE